MYLLNRALYKATYKGYSDDPGCLRRRESNKVIRLMIWWLEEVSVVTCVLVGLNQSLFSVARSQIV